MSAKSVPSGAKLEPGDVCIFDLGAGCQIRVRPEGGTFEDPNEHPVSLSPERLALFARAVLEAQGWLFTKDGRCGGEIRRFPTAGDPEGLGDEMAQALERAVLEAGGWEFGSPGEPFPVTAVRPGWPPGSADRLLNLESYALGILSDALRSETSALRVSRALLALLETAFPNPPTEKAH